MYVYYEFKMYRVVLCIIFAKKSDVNTADAMMKTLEHVWSQMVLVWVKQSYPPQVFWALDRRPACGARSELM